MNETKQELIETMQHLLICIDYLELLINSYSKDKQELDNRIKNLKKDLNQYQYKLNKIQLLIKEL